MEVKKEERCGSEETGRSKTLQDAEFDTMQSDDGVKIDLAFIVFIIKMMANFFVLMGNDKHKTAKVEQMMIDMIVKFFEENKGRSFSEFLTQEPRKEETADNMVSQSILSYDTKKIVDEKK